MKSFHRHHLPCRSILAIAAAFDLVVYSVGAQPKVTPPNFPELPQQALRGALVFPKDSEAIALAAGFHRLYEQSFPNADALRDFRFSDPNAWRFARTNDVTALELARQSNYKTVVRSPFNIALIADKVFGDFILEADVIQTGKEYGHRDMCLFFGFQSPTNFYYAHIATAADDHAHNVFIVNGAPRTKFAKETTKGVNWGLGVWHKVRLDRRVADGSIKVYFDDMTKPLMVAEDKTFLTGAVGFGSFDDTGMVDNIRIWGPSVETRRTDFFPHPQ